MSVNIDELSHEEKYILLELSYIDIDKKQLSEQFNNEKLSIVNVLEASASNPALSEKKKGEINELLAKLEDKDKYANLRDISIVEYENHNKSGLITGESESGFVGYVLEDSNGNRGFLFRGSEVENLDDWIDNINSSAFGNSTQVEQAKAFYNKNKSDEGQNSLYGHSKGGNLSAEVFVDNLDDNIKVYVVNGQPIYTEDLSKEQIAALRGDEFTFIVHEFDPVSGIGDVDYIDLVVKSDNLNPHSLKGPKFDENGNFVSARAVTVIDYFFRNMIKDLFSIIKRLGKAIVLYYYVMDSLIKYAIAEMKSLKDLAIRWHNHCLTQISKIKDFTKEVIQQLTSWFNHAVNVIKDYFNEFKNSLTALIFGSPYSSNIEVGTGQLRALSFQLQRLQRRAESIDQRLNSLARLARLDDKLKIIWLDIGFNYSSDIYRLSQYVNIAADNFETSERKLVSEASALRI